MDDFNQNNNYGQDNIRENENENLGEISGFDDDGYYTKSRSDIIQDEVDNNEYSYSTAPNSFYSDPIMNTKPKKQRKKYGAGIIIVACVLSAIIGFGSSFIGNRLYGNYEYVNPDSLPQVSELPDVDNAVSGETQQGTESTANAENNNITSIAQSVAANCSKSVVGIRTTTSVVSFFGGTSEATGEGSGIIYTDEGYIITNYHVIENAVTSSKASKIEVFLNNANTDGYEASVVGYNISSDLAVLKINAKGLTKIEIGNSDGLSVGQYVVTIGAPGGLEFMGSVTYGIISGLNRVVSSDSKIGLIQTDAAINPGNSGGALLDENGKLIGVNSSKIVSEEFEGMGFAIPVNSVVDICNRIITNKDKQEPYVGITISDKYTSDVLSAYGYPVGAVVLSVAEGSTAESAGIKKGDIITEFNGVEITEYNVFGEVLKKCTPNTSVNIKIYRSGRYYQTKINIGSNS